MQARLYRTPSIAVDRVEPVFGSTGVLVVKQIKLLPIRWVIGGKGCYYLRRRND